MPRRIAGLGALFALLLVAVALPVLVRDQPAARVVFASAALAGLLGLLSAYDLEQLRLPDLLTLPVAAVGLAATSWIGTSSVIEHAAAAVGGALALWLAGRLYLSLRGREGLGLGDVKLFGALATWVGIAGLASTLLIACLTALAALIAAHLSGRSIDAATPVPFGIFLALGGWMTWVYGPLI